MATRDLPALAELTVDYGPLCARSWVKRCGAGEGDADERNADEYGADEYGADERGADDDTASFVTICDSMSDPAEMDNWARCLNCSKWRQLPVDCSTGDLQRKRRGQWVCAMGTDPRYNSCELPEQMEEVTSRRSSLRSHREERPDMVDVADDDDAEDGDADDDDASMLGSVSGKRATFPLPSPLLSSLSGLVPDDQPCFTVLDRRGEGGGAHRS